MLSFVRLSYIFGALATAMVAFGLPREGLAQSASVTTLHSFAGPTNGTAPRAALLRGSDGNFYGTTQYGGPAEQGSVFVLTPAGGLTTLYSFGAATAAANGSIVNADGVVPTASLIQGRDGNFYGTASSGGAYGYGTVFCLTTGGTLTTLHSFNSRDGASPTSALLQATDGQFYGVTEKGGAYGAGTVFALSANGTLTTLFQFTGQEGMRPRGALVQGSDGNFYGTASQGGANSDGTIFKITPAGNLTILYTFAGATAGGDGAYPLASLFLGRDGNFYGTTVRGGTADQGSIFMMTPAGVLKILYSFAGNTDGNFPNAPLLQTSDGTLYGTTIGTAFRVTPAGQFTSLATLAGNSGGPDQTGAGLVVGTDGNLYGTLATASASPSGGVYQLTPAGAVSAVHLFDRSGSEGTLPQGRLAQGRDGTLYGTAARGGQANLGTVFALSSAGTFQVLHQFTTGDAGNVPQGGLVCGSDGTLYGTTVYGNGISGMVFSITPAGVLGTVYRFAADGSAGLSPQAGLLLGSDGNLYGTTSAGGGTSGNGTVFALSTAGNLTTLHAFGASQSGDGATPYAALIQGTNGTLYGTTASGGSAGQGTVFATTTAGAYNLLHSFTGSTDSDQITSGDGAVSQAELVQGQDGYLYGTTLQGGDNTLGTAFVLRPATGALTILHSFGSTDGDGIYPDAGLVQDASGDFYGTANAGGAFNQGTVFLLTTGGMLTTLHSFAGSDGAGPVGTLVTGNDGSFYGTTYAGGLYGLGTVYRLTPGGTTAPSSPAPDAQLAGAGPTSVNQGDNGDAFNLTVANVGSASTGGTVTVTVATGQGLFIAALSGPGWMCVQNSGTGGWTCTRRDALAAGHSYPVLTALVNVSPTASTTQAGTLSAHVTASGDANTANNDATASFTIAAAASTPVQQWRYQYFHTTANAGAAADTANPAGDGLSNLLKYALGLDPTQAEVSPIVVDVSTGYLRLTAPKNTAATDLTYSVQVSSNLTDASSWTTGGTTVLQNSASMLQVRDTTPVKGATKRFIRQNVSR